jgi:putative transposase
MCHISKNLYNEALYPVRQIYFHNKHNPENKQKFPTYGELNKYLKSSENYKLLNSQTSQQIIHKVIDNLRSYWEGYNDWKINPHKYLGEPKLSNYMKKDGEFILIYTNQQCVLNTYENFAKGEGENNKYLKQLKAKYGHIEFGETYLLFPDSLKITPIKTRLDINTDLREVRIIPQGVGYNVEIVYKKEIEKLDLDKSRIVGIDVGTDNIIAIANNIGNIPIIVKGGIVKAANQYFNKTKSKLYSIYMKQQHYTGTKGQNIVPGNTFKILSNKRTIFMKDIMHKLSRYIINYCITHNI